MKPNELRIGNWVYAFKTSWQIDATDFEGDKISTYNQIPLTEEWLVKFFGFEKYPNPNNSDSYIFGDKKIKLIFSCGKINLREFYYPKEIKYVHQLQNLYFALTGTELELKTN